MVEVRAVGEVYVEVVTTRQWCIQQEADVIEDFWYFFPSEFAKAFCSH